MLFEAAGKSLRETQDALDTGNPHVAGFALGTRIADVSAKLTRKTATTDNVAGYLPATRAVTGVAKPWVMLGAHYNHLGHGGRGSSLARAGEETMVHPGADDNASGVAAVLAAAEIEERPARPQRRVRALVGRGGRPARLGGVHRQAAGAARSARRLLQLRHGRPPARRRAAGAGRRIEPVWPALATAANIEPTLKSTVQNDPNLPTDSSSFNLAGIPTLSFFTGSHEDYHRPTDTADRVDAAGIDRIVGYATTIVSRVADNRRPAGVRQGRAADTGARRARWHPALHRHHPRLRHRNQGPAPCRGQRRRPGRAGRPAEGRCHRRDRRPVDRQRLRLHLRARPHEAGRAGQGALPAQRREARNDADAARRVDNRTFPIVQVQNRGAAGPVTAGRTLASDTIERTHAQASLLHQHLARRLFHRRQGRHELGAQARRRMERVREQQRQRRRRPAVRPRHLRDDEGVLAHAAGGAADARGGGRDERMPNTWYRVRSALRTGRTRPCSRATSSPTFRR